ncbi:ATP-binding protein [Desulfolutivibrio sulfoxidireducens]|uniref:ATP-binding protein n=1 Tax=Desulfolutivibrio sulfoxidireducens TaxID=2773299 RepID=UPI00159E02A8|nr:ATP-binding protein [Desulfolutivibrio sulfoxidireducens]QLA16358.1 ATP-binding protein [Desulfolutivibrio sulfoxidireducens]QLA19750.1 ATP-binding protein [Desulfolutivibrio sulfoxidireducens]
MGEMFVLRLSNHLAELDRLAEGIESFGERHGFPRKVIYQVRLVLDELLTNVISYGFSDGRKHEIEVEMRLADSRLHLRIEDDAKAFDPLQAEPPDLRSPAEDRAIGGLGIHLVRKFMDSVRYERRNGKNRLFLEKTIS